LIPEVGIALPLTVKNVLSAPSCSGESGDFQRYAFFQCVFIAIFPIDTLSFLAYTPTVKKQYSISLAARIVDVLSLLLVGRKVESEDGRSL